MEELTMLRAQLASVNAADRVLPDTKGNRYVKDAYNKNRNDILDDIWLIESRRALPSNEEPPTKDMSWVGDD